MRVVAGVYDTDVMSTTLNTDFDTGAKALVHAGDLVQERALCFDCNGATLYGILSVPAHIGRRGVVIVVGGPQYRAGSHRQFALLGRELAASGIPVLRFDYRGMGDSEGGARAFDEINEDLKAAVDCMFDALPELKDVVLWGLCDGASAALFYAADDARISGLVLLNPWLRTEGGAARARLRHYYPLRLFERELWRKIFGGQLDYATSLRSFAGVLRDVLRPKPAGAAVVALPLPLRMRDAFFRFNGRVLLVMSGRDLTAKEFLSAVASSADWQKRLRLPTVTRRDLAAADHTFSRREWRDQVAAWTRDWVRSW